jgi:hypothetical protein
MARRYRALLSVPIKADSDEEALSVAIQHANSLTHPGSEVIAGHLEMLGEVAEGLLRIARVVDSDPQFLSQLPADWRP